MKNLNVPGAASDPVITCPDCGAEIRLTESLAAPMVASIRAQFEERLEAERKNLEKKEMERAKALFVREMEERDRAIGDMVNRLKTQDEKLEKAQKEQAEYVRLKRELEDGRREMELTIEKKVSEQVADVRLKSLKEAEESLNLKIAEKDQTILSMQKTVEELKRKAEQGSQQLQGEVQELQLERILREKFACDSIEPVAKGEHGGDILQTVIHNGQRCGTILWESKRTKNWSGAWLSKLREDMRTAKADIAVLETQAMPREMENFGFLDGVLVVSPQDVPPVSHILRYTLIEVAGAKQASEGVKSKTELLYQYLTGPRFRQRIEAIVEAYSTMKDDLEKERKAILKQWAKREMQLDNVIKAASGIYGDLQGIAGQSLQEIESISLNLPALDESVP
ncbi:MAG: DUF2130 domain-containing protein [Synergistaceae bacterium]|nr:DUF2130 domain-containing protein [Synergistaceae bacterium]